MPGLVTRAGRTALLVTVACVTLAMLSCDTSDVFDGGTYHGELGQVLVIDGHDFSYTFAAVAWSGRYRIDGNSVTFTTTKINGHDTVWGQSTTFDFTATTNSITLSNMRDIVEGGCGMYEGTYTR